MKQQPNITEFTNLGHLPVSSNWLTEQAVLSQFNISKKTIDAWHINERLPRYQIGRLILYKNEDLNFLIEKHKKIIKRRKKINTSTYVRISKR